MNTPLPLDTATQDRPGQIARVLGQRRAAGKAAALAFSTLFSETPILVTAIGVTVIFFGSQAILALLAAGRNPASGRAATVLGSVLLLLHARSESLFPRRFPLTDLLHLQEQCAFGA